MIRNQWYVVLESNEVRSAPIGVTRMGEKMVFWRDNTGKVSAAVDQCPHRNQEILALAVENGEMKKQHA